MTDFKYTSFNADCGTSKRWDTEKLNLLISDYGCRIINNKLECKVGKNRNCAVMRMIQAITAIETYLYFSLKLEEKSIKGDEIDQP